jgi:hypothetical protein
MSLDVEQLAGDMLGAMQNVFAEKWSDVKEYGEAEAKKLAHSFVMIEKLRIANKIDEEEVRLHFNIQKNASRTVLLAIEGLGILAVEQALNAALAVIKDAVNTAIGFTLI